MLDKVLSIYVNIYHGLFGPWKCDIKGQNLNVLNVNQWQLQNAYTFKKSQMNARQN